MLSLCATPPPPRAAAAGGGGVCEVVRNVTVPRAEHLKMASTRFSSFLHQSQERVIFEQHYMLSRQLETSSLYTNHINAITMATIGVDVVSNI